MLTIEKLNQFGADTKEGLTRCFGNEEFYLKLAGMILEEPGFDRLKTALEANDLKAGFEAAHALKGVLGNLSITPMYKLASEMTELLRAGTVMDYQPMLDELLKMKEQLKQLAEE